MDDKDIDVDYDVFIDEDIVEGHIQELGDLGSPKGPTPPHHADFVSRTFIFSPKDFLPTWFHVFSTKLRPPVRGH